MKKLLVALAVALSMVAAEKAPTTSAPDYNAIFKGLKFREIGPAAMGGRVDDFAVVESNPDIIYVGTASGGVLKSVNGGTTFDPIFDDQQNSTIGDITVAPSDPSIVWVGTGESNNRQSSSWGNGVYKSTDAGTTWQHMGLPNTRHIGRIVISSADPNVVYVAAAGSLWGPSKDRGVYKTTDGGATWKQVLFVNEDTGVNDIAMDPESPGTLIAAAYQRRRTVFGFSGSGPSAGLYKTTDGGANWKKLEKGLPWDPDAKKPAADSADKTAPEEKNEIGRIGVNFYRRNPNVVYALVEHAQGGVFRSDDRGQTWTRMSDTNPRGSYYSQIVIDPSNDQRIWVLGAQMYVSDDGGRTFKTNVVQKIHGDYHAMWIDPSNSNHRLTGSDGGIHISNDRGRTWDFVNTVPLGQFYEIGLDMQRPYRICGGLQDNNAWCGPSMSFDQRGIANSDWITVGGGDGFYAQIDPTDPNIVYAESQDGNVLRRNMATHESKSIRPIAPEGERYRFQWNSPIVISAFDPKTIYYGGNYVFKSTNRGDDWTRVSPDLTNNQERDKQPIMGKVPDKYTMSRHDGVQAWPAITTIAESTMNKDLLWAGTDDGNLQVTRDGGKTWKNVSPLKSVYVSRVIASRFNEGTAYATFDGHRSNDMTIQVFKTTDYGATWTPIKNGITDDGDVVNVIREHHKNPNLLFLGTEHALYMSSNGGARWFRVKMNLPTVPVDDIAIHPRENDLVLGTHGRSIWIFDDAGPLEQWNDSIASEDLHLFDLRPATAWRISNRSGNTGHKFFLGPNPPAGALVTYYLKSKAEKVKVAVSDKDGKLVREVDGTGDAGLNRVNWDLRTRPVTAPPPVEASTARSTQGGEVTPESETEQQAAGGGFGQFNQGLRVEPGTYTIKVTAGNFTQTKTVVVEEDPRIQISAPDRAARRAALDQLAPMASQATQARRQITGIRTALKNYTTTRLPENIKKSVEDMLKRVDEVCVKVGTSQQCGQAERLGSAGPPITFIAPPVTQRITQLINSIENYAAAPSQTQIAQIDVLKTLLAQAQAEVKKTQEELAALNKTMRDANIPYIAGRP
jgi:photosystem II stability/assembly factor-like uncharacterized protein